MKIAVITRHAIINYGSLLQALATQKIVESLGHECEIIDYIREQEHYRNIEKNILKNKQGWNKSPLKKALYLAIRQPESIFAGKKFEKQRQQCLKLSDSYSTLDELYNNPPLADIYMTGSDQVWGPVENGTYDEAYTLSFTDKKKIAYAASFGHAKLTDCVKEYYKERLSKYCHVAVREDSAVALLQEMKINALQVLDPTLILDAESWNQYIKPIKTKGKYVLVYQLHKNKRLDEYARKVAKNKGLPLIRVSASFHQIMRSGKFRYCPSVGEFLAYIKNAECMITDSFHGTAFAINFNTPFVEILPNNNTGTRNKSILNLTGLTDRILSDIENVKLANEKIDYTSVNSILAMERKKSIHILEDMINE